MNQHLNNCHFRFTKKHFYLGLRKSMWLRFHDGIRELFLSILLCIIIRFKGLHGGVLISFRFGGILVQGEPVSVPKV